MYALILAHHTFVKNLIQMQGLASFTLCQFRHRYAGPSGHDPGNLILGHTLVDKAQILLLDPFLLCLQLLLKLRQPAILQLRRLVQVITLLGILNIPVHCFYLFPEGGKAVHTCLLVLPLGLFCRKLIMEFRQFLLQVGQTVPAQPVSLFLKSRLLDLHLHDLPGHLIQLSRHGIQLRLDHGTGLIHKVNGLIRKETV